MPPIPGKLTKARFAPAIPVHAPAYRTVDGGDFSDVDILPSALELDENPIASVMFISYGFSHVGPYLEVVHQVECRFRGEQLNYCAHIHVTHETSMLTGREWLGWPKQLADITFDPARFGYDGLITARLE